MALKHLLVACAVATLASFTDAHSALLANSKLLGKLNSGECFNCAVGQYPVPSTIPASAVDAADPADGIGAYIKSKGLTVKEVWAEFQAGTSYGSITEPEAIKGACGRYDPTAVGDVPASAKISYKKSNHNGPAEVWVDGKKTWFGENFITDGGSLKADAFACAKASCNVQWYWIGKVKVKGNWNYYQIYTQCFVVKGSGSGAASTPSAGADADEAAPAPATTKAAETSAPAADETDATPGTVTPAKPDTSSAAAEGSDDKAAKKAEKEKRKAEKAAKKAAKQAAKDSKNLRSSSGSAATNSDEYS